jgi:hypothetical protein
MGNGYFDGQGSREDYYFREYLREVKTGWQQYAPFWIPEMGLRLGQPDGDYHEYRPLPNVRPLYYRHFTRTAGSQTERFTVVVNIWPVVLAGVPRRDALWFYGHLDEFPASPALLVYDHWGDLLELPEWSVVHVGGGGLDLSVRFELPERRHVALVVYDIAGRRVRTLADDHLDRGSWEFTWQGDDSGGRRTGTGVYLWRLTTGDQVQGGRWLLAR